jgi:hypothetical protein
MWVFGGFTTAGVDNDLFCFHFRTGPRTFAHTSALRTRLTQFGGRAGTKTWERVSVSADGAVPSARHLHSAVVSPDGESMVVVGGFSGSVNFSDAFRFHFGAHPLNTTWHRPTAI